MNGIEFTSHYNLLMGELSSSDHTSQNLGMRDIAKPLGI